MTVTLSNAIFYACTLFAEIGLGLAGISIAALIWKNWRNWQ